MTVLSTGQVHTIEEATAGLIRRCASASAGELVRDLARMHLYARSLCDPDLTPMTKVLYVGSITAELVRRGYSAQAVEIATLLVAADLWGPVEPEDALAAAVLLADD